NHWQAEDRAYRIGQARTVNVTYMVAANTLDDFVQTVLEAKAGLINAVVDGRGMAPDAAGDVLDELQRTIRAIATELPGAPEPAGDAVIERLLRQARAK